MRRKGKHTVTKIIIAVFAIAFISGTVYAVANQDKLNSGVKDEQSNMDYYNTVQTYLNTNVYTGAKIKISDSKTWEEEGLQEVQGVFEVGETEHTYHVRFAGKDIVLVTVDNEKILSDMDKQLEYMGSIDK